MSKALHSQVPRETRKVAWAARRARIYKDESWKKTLASPCFVGIDVSKDRLDVHILPSGDAFAVARNGEGVDRLKAALHDGAVTVIVLEATGGFELIVAAALASAGLPLAVVNPRQIRAFARAMGRLAKTDAIDAEIIALFAKRVRPEPRSVADADNQALADLVARRRQVMGRSGMVQNRRRQAQPPLCNG